MANTTSVQELLDRSVLINPHEAIAIVQQLLQSKWDPEAEQDVQATHLVLSSDGEVRCEGCREPTEADLGRLLDVMLPAGTGVRVPGALRLTIARACRLVDAPPFGSLASFSAALKRFERGDRVDLVRQLLARGAVSATSVPPQDSIPERRRNTLSLTALRRELREADASLFELRNQMNEIQVRQLPQLSLEPQPPHRSWALASVAAVLLSFVVGYAATMVVENRTKPSTPGSSTGPALEHHSDQPTPERHRPTIAQEGADVVASEQPTPVGTSERAVERSR